MPRNEFMNHDENPEMDELIEKVKSGEITVNAARAALGITDSPWEEGKDEDLSQEVPPLEESQEVPDGIPLAGLRKLMGLSTTRAHIAQIKAKSDSPPD